MPIKDDMSNLADKAKWKANQQMRLINIHNRITQLEGNIKVQKARLADATVKRFYDNQLNDEVLVPICQQIQSLHNEIENLKVQETATRNEKPPENVSIYSVANPDEDFEGATSGLICPKCGRALHGKFCPEHGIPGVERKQIVPESAREGTSSGLLCPVCGRELTTQFCPFDGAKGVPFPKKETPTQEGFPDAGTNSPIIVCPVCGKQLTSRFCNQHGVAGVPLVKAG
jgi:hypothetical protein